MQKGFGFIELLVGLSIMAALAFFAIPRFDYLLENNQVKQTSQQLFQSVNHAKKMAREKNKAVIFCPIDANHQCSGNWKNPIALFIDANQNLLLEPSEDVLFNLQLDAQNANVLWDASLGKSYLKFEPSGMAVNGSIKICHTKQKELNRKIVINRAGRIRMESLQSCS